MNAIFRSTPIERMARRHALYPALKWLGLLAAGLGPAIYPAPIHDAGLVLEGACFISQAELDAMLARLRVADGTVGGYWVGTGSSLDAYPRPFPLPGHGSGITIELPEAPPPLPLLAGLPALPGSADTGGRGNADQGAATAGQSIPGSGVGFFMTRPTGIRNTMRASADSGPAAPPTGTTPTTTDTPPGDPGQTPGGTGPDGKHLSVRKLKELSGPFEKLNDWNVIEVIVQGNQSTQILNGSTLNTLSGFQWADPKNPGQWVPLTRGKIAVEIEFAETWYRRLEIKALA